MGYFQNPDKRRVYRMERTYLNNLFSKLGYKIVLLKYLIVVLRYAPANYKIYAAIK